MTAVAAPVPVPTDWRESAARERLRCAAIAARPVLDELQRHYAAAAARRRRHLATDQAELRRCEGCGDWLLARNSCTTCPAIAADRGVHARHDLTTTTTTDARRIP